MLLLLVQVVQASFFDIFGTVLDAARGLDARKLKPVCGISMDDWIAERLINLEKHMCDVWLVS